jgi:hypothetical protein
MKYKVIVPRNENAWWCSTFLTSNDHIDNFDEIVSSLRPFKLELISIIGGMKFFDFIEQLDFERVTLFDKNINEISKFILVNEYIQSCQYDKFDSFVSIAKQMNQQQFFLSNEVKRLSLLALDPIRHPRLKWQPTQESYLKVKTALANKLNPNLYLEIPSIDVEGRVVIVFLSHCNIQVEQMMFKKITNASLIIPVYARPKTHDNKGFFVTKEVNSGAFNHFCWLEVVNRLKKGTSIHIWLRKSNVECDQHFTKGIEYSSFLKTNELYDTAITHVFLGKSNKKEGFHSLKIVIEKAKKICSRIIVTDFNKESGQFDNLFLPPATEIIEKVKEYLYPEFEIMEICYSINNRLLFIVGDKLC